MNGKLLIGLLILLGGVLELWSVTSDYNNGIMPSPPVAAQLSSVVAICAGIVLLYSGWRQRPG